MSPDKEKDSQSESRARSESREHEHSGTKSGAQSGAKSEHKESSRSQDKETEKRSDKPARARSEASNKGSRSKQHEEKLPAGKSARTTDHDTIRRWIEERSGSPAAVKATEKGEDPGLLRINFPGYSGEDRLEDISWDEFFKKFDEKKLAFLYQDETRGGETSRFWKFVSRESDREKEEKK